VLDGITIELLQQSVKDGTIMEKLLDASGPLLKKYLIGKLRPQLEPRLKKEGLVWEDALPVLDAITVELLQQCVKDESPEPIMEELAKASGPLLKKYLIGKLRPRLEPRLNQDGATWNDFVEVVDAIAVEILKECAETERIEPILDILSGYSGPIALKIWIGKLQPTLSPQLGR